MNTENIVITAKLFACDPILGAPRIPSQGLHPEPDTNSLLKEMRRLGINRAIVRHQSTFDCGPVVGNHFVTKDIEGHNNLHASWFVVPDGTEPEFDPETMINNMLNTGIKICWTDPETEGFSLLPWCSGTLYEILQSRQIPLMLSYQKIKADELHIILTNFPELRIILLDIPRFGRNRMLYPLLKRYRNLYLCLGPGYSVHYGIENLCSEFGAERWLFGMGFPVAEGGAAVSNLMYADISGKAKRAIAHGNIERLLGEIK